MIHKYFLVTGEMHYYRVNGSYILDFEPTLFSFSFSKTINY